MHKFNKCNIWRLIQDFKVKFGLTESSFKRRKTRDSNGFRITLNSQPTEFFNKTEETNSETSEDAGKDENIDLNLVKIIENQKRKKIARESINYHSERVKIA